MSNKKNDLNEFASNQIITILESTLKNIKESIEFMQHQQNPYLNISSVNLLNSLSINTVESFNKILINSQIGFVEEKYIVLTKYFEFDSLSLGIRKIPFTLLYMDKFISIQIKPDGNILVPTEYQIGEITMDVINNLDEVCKSIESNIMLWKK